MVTGVFAFVFWALPIPHFDLMSWAVLLLIYLAVFETCKFFIDVEVLLEEEEEIEYD